MSQRNDRRALRASFLSSLAAGLAVVASAAAEQYVLGQAAPSAGGWWPLAVGGGLLLAGGAMGAFGMTVGAFVTLAGGVVMAVLTGFDYAPAWGWVAVAGGAAPFLFTLPTLLRTDRLASASLVAITSLVAAGTGVGTWYAALGSSTPRELTDELDRRTPDGETEVSRLSDEELSWVLRGKREAEVDVRRGQMRYLTYGYPSASLDPWMEILRDEYGVTVEPIAGCVVGSEETGRSAGYNRVIRRHLEQVHGRDVLDEAWDRAEAITEARFAEWEERGVHVDDEVELVLADLLGEEAAAEAFPSEEAADSEADEE